MPYYKDRLPGSKNRWREHLRQATKRRALRRFDLGSGVSLHVCRWQDCGYEYSP